MAFPMLDRVSSDQRWRGVPWTWIQKRMRKGKESSVVSFHFSRISIHLAKCAFSEVRQCSERKGINDQILCCFTFVTLPIKVSLCFSASEESKEGTRTFETRGSWVCFAISLPFASYGIRKGFYKWRVDLLTEALSFLHIARGTINMARFITYSEKVLLCRESLHR